MSRCCTNEYKLGLTGPMRKSALAVEDSLCWRESQLAGEQGFLQWPCFVT